ncbi:MAG: SDR family oxidoreductase [Candidatus Limnocylindria bacterium]
METRKKDTTQAPILVTGGTGTLGRQVVARLRASGQPVRILGRHTTSVEPGAELVIADLATGDGVEKALDGVEVVVHCAGSAKGDDVKARTLVDAAKRAGVRHIVYISVVGADTTPINGRIDRAMFGYFGAKHAAERLIADSGIPWTTLRATQFHDLTFKTLEQLSKLPVMPIFSGISFQPVDSGEVADRLVELALGEPVGLVPAIGGPRIYPMDELARSYLAATDRRRPIVGMPVFGAAASAQKAGANLAPDRAVGRRTWEQFLADKVESGQAERAVAA